MALLGIGDLSGGGGAERFFSEVVDRYAARAKRRYDLTLVTDPRSFGRIQSAGCLSDATPVFLLHGRAALPDWLAYGRELVRLANRGAFDVLHVGLVSRYTVPVLWLLGLLPRERRPRIVVNVVDCGLAHTLADSTIIEGMEQRKSYWLHRLLFASTRLDGVFTWYRLLEQRLSDNALRGRPVIVAARHCFVDISRFRPAQEKDATIVFAARFVHVKRPLFFLDGIRYALGHAPQELRQWRFRMYGRGPLESNVRDAVRRYGLNSVVEVGYAADLADVFARSCAFVSTQDYDNFSSVAMLEAMAAGNAIIARSVGQTSMFVEHGRNGLLLDEDTPEGLGRALAAFAAQPEMHETYARRSRELTTTVHTFENFADGLEAFWDRVSSVR